MIKMHDVRFMIILPALPGDRQRHGEDKKTRNLRPDTVGH
jgi:hypothetical protein